MIQGRGAISYDQERNVTYMLRAALAANPRSAEAHYQRGLLLEAQKQNQEAEWEFQAALQIDPQYQAARRELAKLTARPRS